MGKFDRYLLSQLMMLFGFFSLVLVMIYWVNRAVALFDQLIGDGQSAMVFLEFTILTLPNVIRLMLPLSAFAAVVYVANRLTSDSELVVVQATGFSPYRLLRPVLVFGLIVGLFVAVLANFLVPRSVAELDKRKGEIAENVTSQLLKDGTFMHPARGITFYIREISPAGELLDIFLSDASGTTQRTTYTARRALLIRSETGPKLAMFNGMAQILELEDNRLATTAFDEFIYDIGALIEETGPKRRRADQLSTLDLIFPSEEILAETRTKASVLVAEGHDRINQAILSVVAPLVGFACMLVGGFSRFGLWRQILGATVTIIVIKALDNTMATTVARDQSLWPLAYAASTFGLILAWFLCWISVKPRLFTRKSNTAAP
ncbi:MAG: LPS export ABC transporter permease LptF [Rhodobacteraceae bacterium]|nr:LPS export ABC transporter permease LptF [Paracoccaceae bacterium]